MQNGSRTSGCWRRAPLEIRDVGKLFFLTITVMMTSCFLPDASLTERIMCRPRLAGFALYRPIRPRGNHFGCFGPNYEQSFYKHDFDFQWRFFSHDGDNLDNILETTSTLSTNSTTSIDEGDDGMDDDEPIHFGHENDEINVDSLNDNSAINGTSEGYIVTKIYTVPIEGFQEFEESSPEKVDKNANYNVIPPISTLFTIEDKQRLQLHPMNVTLPAALMLLDPETYPTQSKARKSIRQRSVCILRDDTSPSSASLPPTKFKELGKVISRIYPGDKIGFQRRAGSDYYAVQGVPYRSPPFEVPVVYEDDYMAIVNKPPGIVIYRAEGGRGGGARGGGHGRDTLLSALPYVLQPPKLSGVWGQSKNGNGADGVIGKNSSEGEIPEDVPLKRPQPVHRLDRPTSGCLVVAKTKAAAVHLAQQFEFRKARKTYMAIVSGNPKLRSGDFDGVSTYGDGEFKWNRIDNDLEGKSAITDWRVVGKVESLHGKAGQLTLVEVKPKTGRYHQIRRHMAWVCESPLVGDTTYDGGDENALRLRKRGLFLCSNEIAVEHPYYNTPAGQLDWIKVEKDEKMKGCLREDEESGKVVVVAKIDLPEKFEAFLRHESSRSEKFLNQLEGQGKNVDAQIDD
mmetsp:Transcript_7984/g.17113  ORF Transcript_7984/g.17113 Transcript_7984/m.17113 type:complete len:626 (-) Transcript_7984:25-1902(-)